MTGGRVALVLGGARSGKSVEAERLVSRWADGAAVTYVATALLDPHDPLLAAQVAAHRERRPAGWATVDAGTDLQEVLRVTTGPVLLDSLGPWVAASFPEQPDPAGLVAALAGRSGDTVVVSDEVGLAVHPVSESGRWFVDALGAVNQAVAAVAVDVRLVVAGRVLVLPPIDVTGSESDTPARAADVTTGSTGSAERGRTDETGSDEVRAPTADVAAGSAAGRGPMDGPESPRSSVRVTAIDPSRVDSRDVDPSDLHPSEVDPFTVTPVAGSDETA